MTLYRRGEINRVELVLWAQLVSLITGKAVVVTFYSEASAKATFKATRRALERTSSLHSRENSGNLKGNGVDDDER